MDQIQKIQQRLRALVEEGDKIAEAFRSGSLANEQMAEKQKRFDEIQREMDAAEAELAEARKMDKFQKRAASLRQFPDPEPPADPGQVKEDRSDYDKWPVEESHAWFDAARSLKLTGRLPERLHPDLRDAFVAKLEQRAPTGVSTVYDQDGGFAVPTSISNTVFQKIHSEGSLVSRCQSVPVSVGNTATFNAIKENSRASGSRYGGITVGRTAEAGSPSGSKPAWERVSLQLKKQTALVYFTEEQLEDGPQAMNVVENLVPKAFTFDLEDEIYNGTGGSEFEGILSAPALISVSAESGQAASTILYENIVNMYSRMYAPSRSNAVWFINQDIEPQLFTMSLAVGTGGVPVYLPANGVAGSPFGTLMGRPVIPVEHAATLGTVGDIVFADMSQYLYAFKGGLKSTQSMHVNFVQGELAMRFVLRNDGKSWWPSALTPAQGSNTQSPFIALATRS